MSVRFKCPACNYQLSAKSDYVGKEGTCKCGTALIVPGNSEKMKFACRHCSKGISVSNRHAGKKTRCPTCQGIITLPLLGMPVEPIASDNIKKSTVSASAGMIKISCTMCSTDISTRNKAPGTIIECPDCGSFMEVPGTQTAGREIQTTEVSPNLGGTENQSKTESTLGKKKCPSCERKLDANAPVCTLCGIYVKNGRPILTAWDIDSEEVEEKAEGVVRAVSWLIPFGLYPVYSDAIGDHRPYTTWGITAATVLISIWFLFLSYSNSPKMMSAKNLMLWSSKAEPDAEQIQLFYSLGHYGDMEAFQKKREELAEAVPEKELNVAALNELSPEERCFGEYRLTQLITHAFLHGGIMHLAGNMLFLIVLGSRVNSGAGNILMLILYPILAVVAALIHLASLSAGPPVPMLGASGAVMGMAGAYLLLYPANRVYMVIWMRWGLLTGFHLSYKCFALRGFLVVLFYIMFDIVAVSLTLKSNTAHWAHIGGFVAGFIAAFVLLAGRIVYSRSDLLSLVLGKHAWRIIGTPANRLK
ncbi:MAG: rhomboid family intramembrane serine protease [Anaerohalosphaeraceae bacterium]